MTDTATMLKTDVLGRVKVAKAHREALLDVFESSGMSGLAFASHHGVNYQTFASWIQKRRRERGHYPADPPQTNETLKLTLAEIELSADIPASGVSPVDTSSIEVILPDGVALRVPQGVAVSFAVELIRELRSC
jgi:hypothetical protein